MRIKLAVITTPPFSLRFFKILFNESFDGNHLTIAFNDYVIPYSEKFLRVLFSQNIPTGIHEFMQPRTSATETAARSIAYCQVFDSQFFAHVMNMDHSFDRMRLACHFCFDLAHTD